MTVALQLLSSLKKISVLARLKGLEGSLRMNVHSLYLMCVVEKKELIFHNDKLT